MTFNAWINFTTTLTCEVDAFLFGHYKQYGHQTQTKDTSECNNSIQDMHQVKKSHLICKVKEKKNM